MRSHIDIFRRRRHVPCLRINRLVYLPLHSLDSVVLSVGLMACTCQARPTASTSSSSSPFTDTYKHRRNFRFNNHGGSTITTATCSSEHGHRMCSLFQITRSQLTFVDSSSHLEPHAAEQPPVLRYAVLAASFRAGGWSYD